jgi:hypothetical protein
MMISISRAILAALALTALASCGGGGGGDGSSDAAGDSVTVSFGVASLQATAFQNQQANTNASQDASVTVEVTEVASTGTPPAVAYAVVQDTGGAFTGAGLQVMRTADGFRATFAPNVTLAPGTYSGNLVLHVCKDQACAQEVAVHGGTLPYTVTILPQLQVTVFVNGTAAGTVRSGRVALPLSMADGTTVEIRSSVVMQVNYSSGPGFVTVTVDPASTSTDWKAVLARPAFPTTNQIELDVTPKDATFGNQDGAAVAVTMTP